MTTQSTARKHINTRINYGYKREIELPFDEAVERTRTALAGEGFGVLCKIDIKEKLKEKPDVDFGNYLILGAWNILMGELRIDSSVIGSTERIL